VLQTPQSIVADAAARELELFETRQDSKENVRLEDSMATCNLPGFEKGSGREESSGASDFNHPTGVSSRQRDPGASGIRCGLRRGRP
jgi:hypothetical protein